MQRLNTTDPLLVVCEDFLESVPNLSPQLTELQTILNLMARAIPISERPETKGFNPIESSIAIARSYFGKENPFAVRIETALVPFDRYYR
jgi:hypothetical protein